MFYLFASSTLRFKYKNWKQWKYQKLTEQGDYIENAAVYTHVPNKAQVYL